MSQQKHSDNSLKSIAFSLNNLAAKVHDSHDHFDVAEEIFLEALKVIKAEIEQNGREDQKTIRDFTVAHWQNKLERSKAKCASFLRENDEFSPQVKRLTLCPKTLTLKDLVGFSQAIHVATDEVIDDHLLSSIILYNIGLLQKMKGSLDYSIQFFILALKTLPEQDAMEHVQPLLRALIQQNMGFIYLQQGQNEEANNAFSEALKSGRLSLGRNNNRVQSKRTTMQHHSRQTWHSLFKRFSISFS